MLRTLTDITDSTDVEAWPLGRQAKDDGALPGAIEACPVCRRSGAGRFSTATGTNRVRSPTHTAHIAPLEYAVSVDEVPVGVESGWGRDGCHETREETGTPMLAKTGQQRRSPDRARASTPAE